MVPLARPCWASEHCSGEAGGRRLRTVCSPIQTPSYGRGDLVQGPPHDPGLSFRSVAELFRIINFERIDYEYKVRRAQRSPLAAAARARPRPRTHTDTLNSLARTHC